MNYDLIDLKFFGDERGSLIPIEENKEVPFNIKRVYYIYDTKPEIERGKHAHKELEQLIICLHGSCKLLLDDGTNEVEIELNRPDKAIYIGKNMWRSMHDFSHGCILLVLASETYHEKEYIRDYEDFLKLVKK